MSFLQKMGVKFGKNNIPDKKSGMVAADTLLQQTLQSVQNSDFLDGHALLEQDNITLPIFGTGSVNRDEYGILLTNLFAHEGMRMEDVEGVAISSVVPTINFTLEHMCKNYFGKTPMMVAPGIKTG